MNTNCHNYYNSNIKCKMCPSITRTTNQYQECFIPITESHPLFPRFPSSRYHFIFSSHRQLTFASKVNFASFQFYTFFFRQNIFRTLFMLQYVANLNPLPILESVTLSPMSPGTLFHRICLSALNLNEYTVCMNGLIECSSDSMTKQQCLSPHKRKL